MKLATATTGDVVFVVTGVQVRLEPIDHATAKRLRVGRRVYDREGNPVTRREIGGLWTRLSDPTPNLLARVERQRATEEAAARERESDRDERRLNRRVAADWLAAQTDPDEIERLLFGHTLDDVFQVLRQARIV